MKKGHQEIKIKALKTFQEKVHWLYQCVKRIHNMHNRRLRISALDSWGKKKNSNVFGSKQPFFFFKQQQQKKEQNHLLRTHKVIVIK